MKFGKTFPSHHIPEWSIYYMNYKSLKKIIKSLDQAVEISNVTAIPDFVSSIISSFFFELDRDIEKVDGFFNSKFNEYNRRLARITQILGYSNNTINHQIESNEELDEVISILLELRSIYRNLKWFGKLNHKGFTKILKKLDKKITFLMSSNDEGLRLTNNNKENYLTTRVNALPFANEIELISALDIINNILNQLGDEEIDEKVNKNFEFLKIGNRRRYSFDQEFLEKSYDLISKDNDGALMEELGKLSNDKLTLKFLLSLLNKAALSNSRGSIDCLLAFISKYIANNNLESPLFDKSDISGRNFFHQHIISLGKRQMLKEQNITPGESIEVKRLISNKNGPDGDQLKSVSVEGLKYIVNKVSEKSLLLSRDNYKRTPLHYAAQYGLKDVVSFLLKTLNNDGLINHSIDEVEVWGDQEGLTPLHLSILGKHPKTTKNLITYSKKKLTCYSLLLLAVRLNSYQILEHLIEGGIDINYTDLEHNNETALYIASKLDFGDLVAYLVKHRANTEIGENIFGWTPIFIAASEGYDNIVQYLIAGGCRYDLVDDSGWLPLEHACLRGHLKIAQLLQPSNDKLLLYDIYQPQNNVPRSPLQSPALSPHDDALLSSSSIDKLPEPSQTAVNDLYRQLKNNGSNSSLSRSRSPRRHKPKPVKSFGHRYLSKDESLVLLTLGTTDLRDLTKAIDLNDMSLHKTLLSELDTALSLSICCINRHTNKPIEPPVVIDLPLEDQHGSATDPLTFKLTNHLTINDLILTFDIIPTYQIANDKRDRILGRATALLDSAYTNVGPHLRSLNQKITLPIMEGKSLDILGKLKFEYLFVTPFDHSSMNIRRVDTYWKQLVSTRVIGHRGLGKNVSGRKSLQLGENTVESFIAAASLGASYVEFDVQLTKDFVPVVYHDFTVAESGVDIPMHALTAEQFLSLNESKKSNISQTMDDEIVSKVNRPRSMSTYQSASNIVHQSPDSDDELDKEIKEQIRKMMLTKTWKDKGFKGNARGLSVASNFVTLKELFKKLPSNVGFNIELKYPMLDEAEQESMGEIAIDLNFYVDTILKIVYDENTTGRDILFSSFHPDICLLLSLKQPTIPILFLTEAGTHPMADIRASSLQNAIRFAKKWNLLGIVSAAQTLVKAPRLTQVVKSSGLVCVTYGVDNNDPELVKIQMKAGVDAVIADSVLAVREGLRKDKDNFKDYSSGSD